MKASWNVHATIFEIMVNVSESICKGALGACRATSTSHFPLICSCGNVRDFEIMLVMFVQNIEFPDTVQLQGARRKCAFRLWENGPWSAAVSVWDVKNVWFIVWSSEIWPDITKECQSDRLDYCTLTRVGRRCEFSLQLCGRNSNFDRCRKVREKDC